MSWFLVLLFWNPGIQAFDVADGWAPLHQDSQAKCELKLEYVEQYLPRYMEGEGFTIDCIQAESLKEAIAIAKE